MIKKYRFLLILAVTAFASICNSSNAHFPYFIPDSVSTVVADTATITTDSIVVATDTLQSVSSSDTIAVENLEIDTLEIINPYVKAKKVRKHFAIKPISTEEYNACVKFYKENLPIREMYKAYEPWKSVFNSSENRSLTLFNDGLPIILGCALTDTLMGVYENLGRYREEIEEFYDIAIENVDELNAQIDFSKGGDSITVAELRSQQYYHCINLAVLDSIFHASHHNTVTPDNIKEWKEVILRDTTYEVYKHYSWMRDIVYSNETKLYINHLNHFVILCQSKLNLDRKRLDLKQENIQNLLRENKQKDELAYEELMTGLIESDAKNARELMNNMNANLAEFAKLEEMFISADNWDSYAEGEIAKNGGSWPEHILSGALARPKSKLHIEALKIDYAKNPSYEYAVKITKAAEKIADILKYYDEMRKYEEYYFLEPAERASIGVTVAIRFLNGGQTQKAYNYCKEVLEDFPDYPDAYAVMGDACAKRLEKKEKDNSWKQYNECVQASVIAYYYEKAINAYNKLFSKEENSKNLKLISNIDGLKSTFVHNRDKRGWDYNSIYTEIMMKEGADKANSIRKEGDMIVFKMNNERVSIPMRYAKNKEEFIN